MDGRGERKMESGRWREYMYGYDEKGAGKAPPSKRGGGGGHLKPRIRISPGVENGFRLSSSSMSFASDDQPMQGLPLCT
jgi:hypothetical protein